MSENVSRNKRKNNKGVAVTSMAILLATLCTVVSARSERHNFNDINKKTLDSTKPSFSNELILPIDETPYYSGQIVQIPTRKNMLYHADHPKAIEKRNIDDNDLVELMEIVEEPTLVEIEPTYEEKLASFLEYSNIKNEEAFNKFASNFIKYSNNEDLKNIEDVLNVLYDVSRVSMDVKLEHVLDYYNLADEDDNYKFKVVEAVCEKEAAKDGNCYEDSYGVISTIYNRVHSKDMLRYVNYVMNTNNAINLYTQVTCKNQFEVYGTGRYLGAMGRVDTDCYKAVLDMLYLKLPIHTRLGFLSASNESNSSIQLIDGGNNYNSPMKEEDYTDELEKLNVEKNGYSIEEEPELLKLEYVK